MGNGDGLVVSEQWAAEALPLDGRHSGPYSPSGEAEPERLVHN
jgi:hypothetical protein